MIEHALVVVFALCAAIFMAVGIVVRQRATMDVHADDGVSATMLLVMLRRRTWWAGTAAAAAAYGFQALALARGSLLLVAPLLVSALLFALPLSARLSKRRVTRGEWLWAAVLTLVLAVFLVVARPGPPADPANVVGTTATALVCGAVVAAAVAIAVRVSGWLRPVLLAASVGVLFGVIAVLTKVTMRLLEARGALGTLATPAPYGLIAVAVLATLLQQSAFHAGALQLTVPTMLVLEPVVAVALGTVVLGEHLDAGPVEAVVLLAAAATMTAATIALGRNEGAYKETLELRAAQRP